MPPKDPPAPKQALKATADVVRADPKRHSHELIHESVMRGGGEPFLAPFENGTSTLTVKIVKLLKQSGFFGFETMEKLRTKNRRNKFTRHGAAPFVGEYRPVKPKSGR